MTQPVVGNGMLAPAGNSQPAFLSLSTLFASKASAPVSGTDGGVFIRDTSVVPPILWWNSASATGDTSAHNSAWQSLLTGETN